jgi:hypothetical protein
VSCLPDSLASRLFAIRSPGDTALHPVFSLLPSQLAFGSASTSISTSTHILETLGINDTGLIDAIIGLVKETLSKEVSFNATNATTSASATVGAGLPMLEVWGPSIFSAVITALVIKSTVPPVVLPSSLLKGRPRKEESGQR